MKKNRLALESSPYLLKHADNPVDWFPWGEEAFEKARAEDKPVFLSIGYSTCYWCSVMERESFVDPGIGERMNRCVVSIKVDREERPDLDGIYMTAVMLMTGSGGWPMSVFLTPDRKPFFGATYIPRDRFAQLLDAVRAAWAERPDEVRGQAEQVARAVEEAGRIPGGPSASLPGPELAATAAARFAEMFDLRDGYDGAVPSGNSLAVRALTGLAAAGHTQYALHAAATLKAFASRLRETPAALPYMLWGLNEYRLVELPEDAKAPPVGLPSSAGQVKVEGKLSPGTLSPGKPADLEVSLTISPGWHLHANPASHPSFIPTTLEVELPGGEVTATPRYPPGKVLTVGPSPDRLSVYEKRVTLTARIVPVRLPSGDGEGRLAVSVRAQACDDTGRCLAPATIRIEVPFRLTPP